MTHPEIQAPSRPSPQWLLLFRLASSALLLAGGAIIHVRSTTPFPTRHLQLFYGGLGTAFLLSLGVAAALRLRVAKESFGDVQVITDTLVTTALVYATGGQDSVLTFLFPLNTLYAGTMVSGAAGYAVSVMGSGVFAAMTALQVTGILPRLDDPGAPLDRDAVSVVAATASANILVAMLAGQLSEQLRRSGETLRQARVDLGELRTLHTAIVNSVASGLLSANAQGAVALVNPAAERILGLRAGTGAGRPVWTLLPNAPPDLEGSWEELYRHPDGRMRYLSATASALMDDNGRRRGSVVTVTDVTENRKLEEAMAHNRQLATVGQFAAGLAHELRNPLGSMLGCVELLQSSASGHDDDARLLGIVHREAERLAGLVGDFLNYARPAPPQASRLEVAPVLEEMAADLQRDPSLKSVVEVRCPQGLFLRADSAQVRQVLWNLLRNAAQAGGHEKPIALWAQRGTLNGRGAIQLRVRDHGEGLAPQVRQRLFEPFITTKPRGTGLGLAIVHRIVEQHGGTVDVEDLPDAGTQFCVTLPEDDGSLPPVSAEPLADAPGPMPPQEN